MVPMMNWYDDDMSAEERRDQCIPEGFDAYDQESTRPKGFEKFTLTCIILRLEWIKQEIEHRVQDPATPIDLLTHGDVEANPGPYRDQPQYIHESTGIVLVIAGIILFTTVCLTIRGVIKWYHEQRLRSSNDVESNPGPGMKPITKKVVEITMMIIATRCNFQ